MGREDRAAPGNARKKPQATGWKSPAAACMIDG